MKTEKEAGDGVEEYNTERNHEPQSCCFFKKLLYWGNQEKRRVSGVEGQPFDWNVRDSRFPAGLEHDGFDSWLKRAWPNFLSRFGLGFWSEI